MPLEFLWYIPNTVESGHRGDDTAEGWGTLDFSAEMARAAATLDQLGEGRLLVNIVTGKDDHKAYGDFEEENADRYARTREFMQVVRQLWTREDVTYRGRFFSVEHSTCLP